MGNETLSYVLSYNNAIYRIPRKPADSVLTNLLSQHSIFINTSFNLTIIPSNHTTRCPLFVFGALRKGTFDGKYPRPSRSRSHTFNQYHIKDTKGEMAGDEGESNCPHCNTIVLDDTIALECKGFCKKWFHGECVKINSEEYGKTNALSEKVKWYCVDCSRRFNRVLNEVCDYNDYITVNETVIN
ncbi:hypothetical protein J6590_083903 [Homalodisca vitripennis]|nr:hypothetical protein J6590_083903 [Homalodisca vitripennis]